MLTDIDPVLIALSSNEIPRMPVATPTPPTTSAIQPIPPSDLVLEPSSGPTRSTTAREGEWTCDSDAVALTTCFLILSHSFSHDSCLLPPWCSQIEQTACKGWLVSSITCQWGPSCIARGIYEFLFLSVSSCGLHCQGPAVQRPNQRLERIFVHFSLKLSHIINNLLYVL
jgi:hypothetical protein